MQVNDVAPVAAYHQGDDQQIEHDEEFYEEPKVTLERLMKLEVATAGKISELGKLIG